MTAASTISVNPSVSSPNIKGGSGGGSDQVFKRNEKTKDVRHQNILAAKAVADAIRTSLGPRGMDKMIQEGDGSVIITNDGATILNHMAIKHPVAKMLVELSRAQDIEAGDGTTTVVVLCGAMLAACETLLDKGIHPQHIAYSFQELVGQVDRILQEMSIPVDLHDRDALVKSAATALNSKVVCQNAPLLAPMAVDAVLKVVDIARDTNVDLNEIKVVKKLGGTVDDSELVNGLVFTDQKVVKRAGGTTRVTNAKIGLIQFCLSTPKTDMENNITIRDYQSIDRLLREERLILAKMVKKIAATGCNVLLIQKSILRDATTDLSLDYLAKSKILVVKDIERNEIEFISKTLGCDPVASLDEFTADKLGNAACVCDEDVGGGSRIVRITGTSQAAKTVTVLLRASNALMLDEAERSMHDALCVVRSLVKTRALLPGGAAPEIELAHQLHQWSRTLSGARQYCVKAYADALEVIPYTLAENGGLNPIQIVTELRNRHAHKGEVNAGINVRKAAITNILEENVVQPLLVTSSAVKLATETVMLILKIDDTVMCR